jgi:hypothetical protein
MSLTSISDLETYTGKTITGTDDEALYTSLIDSVSAEIETICYRKFNADDYTETFDGNGTTELYLNQFPINTVTTVEYGTPFDVANNPRIEIESDEYVIDSNIGMLEFLFSSAEKNQYFKISYNAGYTTIPADLNLIATKWVETSFNNTKVNGNYKSEKLGDYSYTVMTNSERTSSMKTDLAKWIRKDL